MTQKTNIFNIKGGKTIPSSPYLARTQDKDEINKVNRQAIFQNYR